MLNIFIGSYGGGVEKDQWHHEILVNSYSVAGKGPEVGGC